MEVEGSSR